VVRAQRVTDEMIAGADAVATLTDPTSPGAALLPPVTDLRTVSATVAIAVGQTAGQQGLAEQPLTDPVKQNHQAMWRPK
jgi:malate dehydrogenase (oxaloacetate-decarboxylating)